MKNPAFMNAISRNVNRVGLQLKKHSPEIMLVTGIVTGVAAAVMACQATTKVNDILEEAKTNIDAVHDVLADESIPEEKYSEEDGKKDLAVIYIQTGVKFIKLYGPAIALGAFSVTNILASHNIMRKRNVALAAAYTAVDTGFKEYRGRVVDRFGKELDRELRYNIKAKEVEEVVVDEKGKEKTVKKTIEVVEPGQKFYSDYARCFDDGCTGWTKDPEYNLMFLRQQQNYANDLLKARGHLFLNEVYSMLGIPKTKAGQVVGWIYDENDPNMGDGYVDFGIYDLYKEGCRDFVNGYERSIWLDFNVDGVILDRI